MLGFFLMLALIILTVRHVVLRCALVLVAWIGLLVPLRR